MKESYKCIQDLRSRLLRWYDGDADPALTKEIMEIMRKCEDLPADLQSDREMFLAMDEAASESPEMPEEYSGRIDAALAGEMRSSRPMAAPAGLRRQRRWRYATAAAVASLFMLFAGMHFWRMDIDDIESNSTMTTTNAAKPLMARDTIRTVIAAISSPLSAQSHQEDKPAPRIGVRTVKNQTDGTADDLSAAPDSGASVSNVGITDRDTLRHSEEEYADYIAANYRVVKSDAEASAIISGIFASVDTRMTEVSCDMNDIKADYDVRVSCLQGI